MDSNHPIERPVVGAEPRKSGNKAIVVVGLVVGVAFAGLMGSKVMKALDKRKDTAAEREAQVVELAKKVPVEVTSPIPMRWKPAVELTGTLRPFREADIGFETSGRLVKLNVATGDKVKQGSVLAVLDGSRAGAQVGQAVAQSKAAEANLALAEDNLKRTEALVASKSIPEAQAEAARQQVALAKAQLEGAKATTVLAQQGAGMHAIVAPFDGIVTRAPTAIGSVVAPGAPLVRVEDVSKFRLSASVGEDEATLVHTGIPAVITYQGRKVTGKVIAVVPSLDQATRRVPVEIEVPNDPKSPLLGYGFVRARIEGSEEMDALRVPAAARRPGSQNEVVRLVDGKAQRTKVVHVVDTDGSWIVTQGLGAGDKLVLAPSDDVRDGDALEVAQKPAAPAK
ncbi:MAG: efflux RND transporter periplasmic adaptor subunit [Myxococcales bacterium]|jgi:RND family efflux transporter MFP subunit|nr:efflux RND transporter periplasmic adaptor subunit [Myxococcales bacterium]MBL9112846.1 efflux RND transporter periplasmic adaptor subunit [Myxococcales bacterium]